MIKWPVLERELVAVTVDPSQTSFKPCARVVSDQPSQTLVTPVPDEPSTIERMEAGQRQLRRITNVVQEGSSDQRLPVVPERTSDPLSCCAHSDDMIPTPTERSEMILRCPPRPRND